MIDAPQIRKAIPAEAAGIAGVVATAFYPLDICQWLIPHGSERAAILPDYFHILVDHALGQGTVEVTDDLTAVAVWLPAPLSDPVDYDSRLAAACGPWTSRIQVLDAAMHDAHPRTWGPHDYLAFLAVRPHMQGRGLGTALLAHHHTALDEQRRPAYLEASNSRSRTLYARHGYTDCADTLNLPYQGERMYPMWRNPQHDPVGLGTEPRAGLGRGSAPAVDAYPRTTAGG